MPVALMERRLPRYWDRLSRLVAVIRRVCDVRLRAAAASTKGHLRASSAHKECAYSVAPVAVRRSGAAARWRARPAARAGRPTNHGCGRGDLRRVGERPGTGEERPASGWGDCSAGPVSARARNCGQARMRAASTQSPRASKFAVPAHDRDPGCAPAARWDSAEPDARRRIDARPKPPPPGAAHPQSTIQPVVRGPTYERAHLFHSRPPSAHRVIDIRRLIRPAMQVERARRFHRSTTSRPSTDPHVRTAQRRVLRLANAPCLSRHGDPGAEREGKPRQHLTRASHPRNPGSAQPNVVVTDLVARIARSPLR
jgi:hypothetical protein